MSDIEPPAREPGPMIVNRPGELSYAGLQTFLKLPVCLTPADLRAGGVDIAIAGVPWDGTATTRSGTQLGPKAIRAADHLPGWPAPRAHLDVRVDPLAHLNVVDYGDS